MYLDPDIMKSSHIYHAMIQTILPRPIAWVLTDHGENYNLAPFSYFMGVSSSPPLVALSIGRKKDLSPKDTVANIERHPEFVIHIPSRGMEESVTKTSEAIPAEESEIELAGLDLEDFPGFPLPRLRDAKVAFGCRLHQMISLEGVPQTLVIGRLERIFLHDDIAVIKEGHLKVDPVKLDPLARLGGDDYGLLGEVKTVPRKRDHT